MDATNPRSVGAQLDYLEEIERILTTQDDTDFERIVYLLDIAIENMEAS